MRASSSQPEADQPVIADPGATAQRRQSILQCPSGSVNTRGQPGESRYGGARGSTERANQLTVGPPAHPVGISVSVVSPSSRRIPAGQEISDLGAARTDGSIRAGWKRSTARFPLGFGFCAAHRHRHQPRTAVARSE